MKCSYTCNLIKIRVGQWKITDLLPKRLGIRYQKQIDTMIVIPVCKSMVIESDASLASLMPISLFALTLNWYVLPGTRSSITVVVFITTPAAMCHNETQVSLYSIVYAVIGIRSKVSGGSHARTTDVEVIAVMHGLDGEPGFDRPRITM